ncbi:MAG: hypothetical protein FJ217_08420 [Ignavibacteria bacterium]|nr:hypothetical protein [Ignavibacteria bacterium]
MNRIDGSTVSPWSVGSTSLKEKSHREATDFFGLCHGREPTSEFAYLRLAEAFEGNGQLAEAVDVYQKAHDLAARKKSPHMHVLKGELERVKKRASEE